MNFLIIYLFFLFFASLNEQVNFILKWNAWIQLNTHIQMNQMN